MNRPINFYDRLSRIYNSSVIEVRGTPFTISAVSDLSMREAKYTIAPGFDPHNMNAIWVTIPSHLGDSDRTLNNIFDFYAVLAVVDWSKRALKFKFCPAGQGFNGNWTSTVYYIPISACQTPEKFKQAVINLTVDACDEAITAKIISVR